MNPVDAPSPADGLPTHVMVVDDDELVLRTIRRILESMKIARIDLAGDGDAALTMLGQRPHPEVIICDLRMPNVDGVELLRHIAKMGFDGHFIIMSGEDDRLIASVAGLARSHGLSVLGAVQKPMTRAQLETLLRAAVQKRGESHRREAPASAAEDHRPTAQALARYIAAGAIRAVYQPKVSVESHRVVGVESLCRLEIAPGKLIGPGSFIETAERADLMNELSFAMVTETIRQAAEWQSAHDIRLRFAINITVNSIKETNLPEFILNQLGSAGIEPARMTFEVTETQLIEGQTLPLEIFNRLHLMGIGLSIDDFGTGYSSFLQLRRLPFNELKIDRSFVSEALGDRTTRAIIETSVLLAQKLGMNVVAEGVESDEELGFIEGLGVDEIQGYLVARPMDGTAFVEWMREHAPGGLWRGRT